MDRKIYFFRVALICTLAHLLITTSLWAQVPQKISYQAVVRKTNNQLVVSQQVGMRITILQGSVTGATVYTETLTPTTNSNGLVTVEIGSEAGFSTINWANGIYYIKTETDPTGGSTYTITGVSQLLSVPYALHSKTAETLTDAVIETDPAFTNSPAANITTGDIEKLNNLSGTNTGDQDLTPFATKNALSDSTATVRSEIPDVSGFLSAETDPPFTNSQAANITVSDITKLNNLSGTNTGDQDITGIATNATAITTIQTEQTAQNAAIEMNTAKIGVTAGTTPGQMQYWNGTAWLTVAPGLPGQFLQYTAANIPTWSGNTYPTLTTTAITNITTTTATGGGDVTSDGGATVTARGICYSTSQNPTTASTVVASGTGTGIFTSNLIGLTQLTTYYVRAYATNSVGTAYGNQQTFNIVPTVINPTTGKIWMDRNLGATRAATSSTDEQAYGDLYQWGRVADGHQNRTSDETSALSSSDTPGHGNFIITPYSPHDWRNPQNDNLWQGVNGTNNPCPTGFRLPSEAEWEAERASWSSNDDEGAFASPLKLPVAGQRISTSGTLAYVGFVGRYWSSTVDSTNSRGLGFYINNAYMYDDRRTSGFSVRCIKE